MLSIHFSNPSARLQGEKRSKLLKPDSDLCKYLREKRTEYSLKYPDLVNPKRMEYHIELIQTSEKPTEELLVQRAQSLEGYSFRLVPYIRDNAVVLDTPFVPGYGQTHVTIAHFKTVPTDLDLSNLVKDKDVLENVNSSHSQLSESCSVSDPIRESE